MREIRSSGSVEGVMGNHDSYSDSSLPASALAAGRAAFCFDCYGTFSAPPSRLKGLSINDLWREGSGLSWPGTGSILRLLDAKVARRSETTK